MVIDNDNLRKDTNASTIVSPFSISIFNAINYIGRVSMITLFFLILYYLVRIEPLKRVILPSLTYQSEMAGREGLEPPSGLSTRHVNSVLPYHSAHPPM